MLQTSIMHVPAMPPARLHGICPPTCTQELVQRAIMLYGKSRVLPVSMA